MANALDAFLPPVQQWFCETFGEPTPPQAQGWLPIQRGEHTLILAPTGSGKTLAAFLWGIDRIYRELDSDPTADGRRQTAEKRRTTNDERRTNEPTNQPPNQYAFSAGIHLLYISPLKALNNDIERNLRVPLEGIRDTAQHMNVGLPGIHVAVRTGDTPSSARAQMLKRPPHILITTPESLYLMLTSPRAREMFRSVRTVIVDEIHTLVGDKRGVHLSLTLERLVHFAQRDVQRIGLSATIKPLDEIARFLGGHVPTADPSTGSGHAGRHPTADELATGHSSLVARPVTIVNANYHKALDLKVVTVVEDFNALEAGTIWPYIVPRVLQDIREHHTTLIFTNNRRLAERTSDRLNAQLAAEESEEIPPGSSEALAPGGTPIEGGIFAIGAQGPIRAHHGSMAKERRRELEEQLKSGTLPALVGTSSLELGIDIGSVDLVVQLQSPKSVAQGLQRVGRAGHLVGQTSVGRIYPSFAEDLLEAAAVARGMLDGDVEPTFTPQNPLDVLAQQIVAMVASDDWDARDLYALVCRAYAYRELSFNTFMLVVEMLAGKYEIVGAHGRAPLQGLRPRIAFDRVHNRLSALPGSRLLAMSNAGTITERGVYSVYLSDGKTRVGELDEEFVYETRVGNTFILGSQTWRVLDIQNDRVIVGDAAGALPRMPFWHGDQPWRTFDLGVRLGRFRREISERIRASHGKLDDVAQWLRREFRLDDNSAQNLIAHVRAQLDAVGVISSDQQIVIETFQDAVGSCNMAIHSPFGGRVNGAWALALTSALRERMGLDIESQTSDDGILFRFPPRVSEPPLELVRMSAQEARERILRELPNSAMFGAHFRMNAQRALLMPKARGRKRTPFWLQRLKAKDLLAVVRQYDDFPIIAESYRDCVRDVLDLPHLEDVLTQIQQGAIAVTPIETLFPSPIANGLLLVFQTIYQYEWDTPKAERDLQTITLRRDVLDDLLGGKVDLSGLLKPAAISDVNARAQHSESGYRARSLEELALYLYELGDLTLDEIVMRSAGDGPAWIEQLARDERAAEMLIPTAHGLESRWVHIEHVQEYREAFGTPTPTLPRLQNTQTREGVSAPSPAQRGRAREGVLRRHFRNSGPLTRAAILDRYAFDEEWLDATLAEWVATRELVRGHFTAGLADEEFCDRRNLEQIHQRTLTLLRKEVQPVAVAAYAEFLTRWQHAHPHTQLHGEQSVREAMLQLRGVALPSALWEREVLTTRVADFTPMQLDALAQSGELIWVAAGRDARHARARFFFRGEGSLFLDEPNPSELSEHARTVLDFLQSEGASFTRDIELGTALNQQTIGDALVELALAELITNDSVEALRALARYDRPAVRDNTNALERELAARMSGKPQLTSVRYRAAKRRVHARLDPETVVVTWSGHWSLVGRVSLMGKPLSDEERAEKLARVLLARYGVVMREVLERETLPLDWTALYPQLQRMEMRGEVRRGYFVSGLSGLQFALPAAVEHLRERAAAQDDTLVLLNATDPANLYGADVAPPMPYARVPSTHVVLSRGDPLLVSEENGRRMKSQPSADDALITRALQLYLARPHAARHVVVDKWNDEPVLGSAGESILRALGFQRTPNGMERWSAQ